MKDTIKGTSVGPGLEVKVDFSDLKKTIETLVEGRKNYLGSLCGMKVMMDKHIAPNEMILLVGTNLYDEMMKVCKEQKKEEVK